MKNLLSLLLLLFLSITLSITKIHASHAVGIDIYYECLGGNQYRFYVNLYRDCDGIDAPSSVSISINSPSCGINTSTTLSQISSQNVSQICGAQINNTSCNGGSLPGIEQYVYSGVFTLPQQCSDWTVSYSLCCRNGGITNLASASSQNLYVQATINNTGGNCNSSPQFSALPTPYLCVGQPFSFNNGAVDPDGNTLVYSLVNPMSAANTNIPYTGGYSPTNPMAVTGTFNFDPATGQMQFTPSQVQQGVITVLVEEYENGVLVGTTMRDIQVVVINCSNTPPTGTGVNGSATAYDYDICSGSSFCFDINSDDVDANTTSMTWNNGIPGGTFTTSGAPFVTGSFCWTPTANDIGTHYFTVTVQDDACPIPGINTYTFEVNVTASPDPPVDAGNDQDVCLGESTSLNATTSGTGATFNWSPANGLSCTSCQSPNVSATTNQIYTVTATYPSGCSQTDQVAVNVAPSPFVSVFPADISICSGSSATLTANSPTATGYSWSPGGMTGAVANVSPASSTTYTVTATNSYGCTSEATSNVTVSPPPPTEVCNNIYVTTTGTGTGDSPSDPTNLADALLMSQCNNATVKMAIGTYTIDNAITDILGYTTLEGGYDPSNNWTKTSFPGATTIYRSTANPEGPSTAQRLVAIYMNSASFFRFQDLTIQVADAVTTGQEGMSTYGIHMTSCSDYDIVRCQIIAGNASNGGNGVTAVGTGSGAAGGNGGAGGARNSGCDADGQNGSAGQTGNGGASAGTGGGGANGDGCNIFGCNASPTSGGNGGNGANGVDGTDAPATAPATNAITGSFFLPNGQSQNGSDGQSGGGGGGGGGMSRGSDCTCSFFGTGNGGDGGAGGNAGVGGTGGYGGGGAFSVFLVSNQGNGNFTDVVLGSPSAGNGGAAGLGQNGSNGVGGGPSQNAGCGGSSANSGAGGNGGNGGNGGDGQPGANGAAGKIYTNGTTPLFTQGGSVVSISTGITSPADFNLIAQPEIFAENISCANTNIDFSGVASNSWNFGSSSIPTTSFGTNATSQYTGLGRKDIQYGNNTYSGFVNITWDGVTNPDINSTALEIATDTFVVCVGNTADFYTTAVNFTEFNWDFGGAITPNNYTDMNLPNLLFNSVGTFTVRLQGRTDCCGWSSLVEVVLIVDEYPTVTVAGDMDYCEGEFTTLTATSDSDSLVWSPNYGINIDTGNVVTFNPPATTDYLVTAYSFYGLCSATENFTVTVNEIPNIAPTSTGVVCADDGTASANSSGGSGSYNYQWNDIANQTTATASNLYTGNYQIIVTDAITGCADTNYAYVGASPAAPVVYISNSQNVSCYLGNDGEATASVAGGSAPYDFTWADVPGGVTQLIENGVATSTLTGLMAGTYNVFITDNAGCEHTIDVDISQPDTSIYIIDSTIYNATCYATNDGAITIQADGGSGGFTYLWDINAGGSTLDSVGGLNPGPYSITITDINGCTFSEILTVTGPTVELFTDAGQPDTLCGGEYMLQAIPTPSNSSGNWLNNLTTGPGTANFSSLTDPNAVVDIGTDYGTYTFYWTEDNGLGCSDTVNVEIVFLVPPTVSANVDDTICGLFTYSLNGASNLLGNTWNTINGSGNITFDDANSLTSGITVDAIGSYEIELLGVNQIGCEARDTITLYFSDPTFTAIHTDDECSANIGNITVNSTTGTAGNILYSNDNGVSFQTSNLFSSLGEADYDVVIIDDYGCIGTNIVSVGNNGTLTFIDTTLIHPSCYSYVDGEISIDATTTALPLSYSIDGGVQQASNVFAGLGNGSYSIVISDANLCTDTIIVSLVHPDSIMFDTTLISPLCFGDCNGEINFSNVNGGNGTFTYSIDNGTTNQVGANFSNLCTGSYDLLVSDGMGCQSTMNLILSEPSALTLDITIDSASCNGVADGQVSVAIGGGTNPYDYNWNGLALNTENSASNVSAGTYDLTVTDNNGCIIDTLSYPVGEPIAVTVGTVVSSAPLCYGGQDGSITVTSPSNISGWSLDGVTFQGTSQFNNLNSGTYQVYVQDVNGCINSVSHIVNSNQVVTADATSNVPLICVGQTANLIGTGTGGVGNLSLSWDQNIGAGANHVVSPIVTTTYELTVTDENGCSATDFVTINVNPTISVSAFADITICPGGTASISSLATGGDGNNLPSNYVFHWSNGNTGMNQNVSPSATTTYSVYATDGCSSYSDTAYVTVTVSTPPVVDFTVSNNSGCKPVNAVFTDPNGGNGASCLWNFGDGYVSSDCGNVTHEYTESGVFDVSYTVTNGDGCSTTLTVTEAVEVYDYPIAEFTFNPEIGSLVENEITYTNGSFDGDSYFWSFGDSVAPQFSSNQNPVATYPDFIGGVYETCLIVTNTDGCQDSICKEITIEDQLLFYVPNTFTPNGDGRNDVFMPSALGINADGYRLMIFNRWGEKIFETTDSNYGWDGTYLNESCPIDTYVWKIELSNTADFLFIKKYTGHVNLLR